MSLPLRSTTLIEAFLFIVCLVAGLSLHAQIFLTMEVQQEKKGKMVDKGSSVVSITSDGDRIAIETTTDGTEAIIIYDTEGKTMTTISTHKGERSAIRMPLIKLPKSKQDGFEGTFVATGEKKTIIGYSAEKYRVTDDGTTSEMWVADIPGFDYGLIAEGVGQTAAAKPAVAGVDNPMVLEAHSPSKNGKEVVHMYIRAVATGGDVDLGAFEVPAGVELQDMSAMLKGFGQ